MGWDGRSSPIPAVSRSFRSPTAPSPTRSRAGAGARRSRAACSRSARRGSASAPTSTAPSSSSRRSARWRSRPQLGSDIALVFDECTPFHADRDYTAALDRAHPSLARPLPRLARRATGPPRQAVFGIVQGGTHEDLRRESADGGRRRRGRRDRDRRHARQGQGADARGRRDDRRRCCPPTRPSTCSGSASPTTSSTGSAAGSTASTARSRPGSAATGWRWRRCPSSRFRYDVRRRSQRGASPGRWSRAARAPPARGHSRAYVHYLSRAEELTGVRLLTLHNLVYTARARAPGPRGDRRRPLRGLPRRDPRRRRALGGLSRRRRAPVRWPVLSLDELA